MPLTFDQLKINGNPQMESMISSAMKMKGDENAMSKINIDDNGGDDDKNKKSNRLSFDQIKEWNKYMSTQSNGGDLMTLFNNYLKQNPHTSISFDSLRNELDLLTQKDRQLGKQQNLINQNESHTGNMFPMMRVLGSNSNSVVNGDLQTENQDDSLKLPDSWIKKTVPDWVDKLEWDSERNQPYYKDGNDIVFVDKKFYNSDRFRKPLATDNDMIASK